VKRKTLEVEPVVLTEAERATLSGGDPSLRTGTAPVDQGSQSSQSSQSSQGDQGADKRIRFVRTSSLGDLRPQVRDDLPLGAEVWMRPRIVVSQAGLIDRIQVSGRTPSPFGARMGDHTVAWQALVDAVRAALYGLTLGQARAALLGLQDQAAAWTTDRGSGGIALLRLVVEPRHRADRLQDAAARCAQSIEAAGQAADDDERKGHLGQAIAYHLAYLNYLPFATVPAASARGSSGGTEGHFRQTLMAFESAPPAEPPVALDDASRAVLRTALWGLFAFDAAVRESHLEYVVDRTEVTTSAQQSATLARQAAALQALTTDASGLSRVTATAQEEARKIYDAAVDPGIQHAAATIRDQARVAGEAALLTRTRQAKAIANAAQRAGLAAAEAARADADLAEISATAPARALRVLSYLLHKHQRYMAVAFPRCVRASGFLDRPVTDAAAELRTQAREAIASLRAVDDTARTALDTFMIGWTAAYGDWGVAPAAGTGNDWAASAVNDSLVVTYDAQTGLITVNGRADAPTGVEGMGSHTTAWVVETEALQAMITDVADPLADVQAAVLDDLGSAAMRLDIYLPADQLHAGQLVDVLDAAQAVQDAERLEDAAARYLEFRNLLPFATVDAGNRGGHGEGRDASEAATFDQASLQTAADLQSDALTDAGRVAGASRALEDASSALEAARTARRWPDANVEAAARESARRMRKLASALARDALEIDVAAQIMKVRRAEHRQRYQQAGMPKVD
jgi:hypothetical protein